MQPLVCGLICDPPEIEAQKFADAKTSTVVIL